MQMHSWHTSVEKYKEMNEQMNEWLSTKPKTLKKAPYTS